MKNQNNHNEIEYRKPVIKVIGLGGGGGNAVSRMIEKEYDGAEFIAANTDAQALKQNLAPTKILLGPDTARGMGSGGIPENGERAALESEYELRKALQGADIVFLTAGMGGGTGSGAIPIAARIAREIGAVTISVVSTPFTFESGRRIENARKYMNKLADFSDTLIAIPNDQLLKIVPHNLSLKESFEVADDVLRQGVMGLSQLLTGTGEINVDFSHVRNMLLNGGGSLLSIGYGKGHDKVKQALEQALNHPLLERLPIENATGLIVNFTGNENLSFTEVIEGMTCLQEMANNRAEIIPGQVIDNSFEDEVQVILIITGIASTPLESLARAERNPFESHEPLIQMPKPEPKPIKIETAVADIKPEPILQPEFSYPEPKMIEASADASVAPETSAPRGKMDFSPAADAAFDTFLSPLGLSGFDASSITFINDNEPGGSPDLDVPTFIRRKL